MLYACMCVHPHVTLTFANARLASARSTAPTPAGAVLRARVSSAGALSRSRASLRARPASTSTRSSFCEVSRNIR
eukprot:scaffold1167_cov154-Isochrysis_galbana.AAC.1